MKIIPNKFAENSKRDRHRITHNPNRIFDEIQIVKEPIHDLILPNTDNSIRARVCVRALYNQTIPGQAIFTRYITL